MAASACVTIALPHLFIGIWQRRAANLLVAIAARAVAAIAAAEFAIMSAQTPEQIGRAQQWGHVPVFVLMVVALYFKQRTGCSEQPEARIYNLSLAVLRGACRPKVPFPTCRLGA